MQYWVNKFEKMYMRKMYSMLMSNTSRDRKNKLLLVKIVKKMIGCTSRDQLVNYHATAILFYILK